MNPLDNPVWSSLEDAHARFARRSAHAARYPPDVAPFVAIDASLIDAAETDAFAAPTAVGDSDVGVADAPIDADDGASAEYASTQLAQLVDPGESVLFVGPAPRLSRGWRVEPVVYIAQMLCERRIVAGEAHDMIELTPSHRADVLDLTSRVYPHYFRPRTVELGRYFGIYDGHKLAAMAGERMRFEGHVELSAICTDPAYLGRGYAQRLVAMLTNDILDGGCVPFLHVAHENTRAKKLYEHMGYRFRADIPLVSVTRQSA
jgi:ribosomal protein S18 acetylase RimI-like enzyme